jgi:hypothetical protein
MILELKRLKTEEQDLIYRAPFLVSLLIAGADGTIDRKEVREAIRFAENSLIGMDSALARLMREITADFEDKLKVLIQYYPYEATQRNPLIVQELEGLNALWSRIDKTLAIGFYTLLLDIAHHIAESSGGVMGIRSVGSEEARYVRLNMIKNPAA